MHLKVWKDGDAFKAQKCSYELTFVNQAGRKIFQKKNEGSRCGVHLKPAGLSEATK